MFLNALIYRGKFYENPRLKNIFLGKHSYAQLENKQMFVCIIL